MTRYTNKIYQPLRFYTDNASNLALRNAQYGYKNIVPLVASRTKLLPFQLYRPSITTLILSGGDYISVYVVNYKTGVITDLTSQITLTIGTREIGVGDYEQYVTYDGNTTFSSALGQGVYYIHAISKDSYHYYSDLFKVGFFDTIDIEFNNSYSFGNLWMNNFYWKASYEGMTYDPGEFSEYSESNKNDDNLDKFTYQRVDKLRAVSILVDSNGIDTLKMAKMCDSVYITDELGIRQSVEIMDITAEPFNKSNYITCILKYRVIDDSIITVKPTIVTVQYSQTGTTVIEAPGVLTFDGRNITFDGQTITQ
jgi:hypothetical protein